MFGGLLVEMVQFKCDQVCGEDTKSLENFTALNSLATLQCIGLSQLEYVVLSIPVQKGKDLDLQILCAPYLTLWL